MHLLDSAAFGLQTPPYKSASRSKTDRKLVFILNLPRVKVIDFFFFFFEIRITSFVALACNWSVVCQVLAFMVPSLAPPQFPHGSNPDIAAHT